MQERQTDRTRYFNELAQTSEKYFLPYISSFKEINPDLRILEIGCGDGGNLLPFARRGCRTLGVDISPSRIAVAKQQFAKAGVAGEFIASDIFKITELRHQFDLIICHDVLEHISDKQLFLKNIRDYLATGGIVFMSFPAWQMPFGGHQQICRGKVLSHLPWIHLLPRPLYSALLRAGGERPDIVRELLNIKQTRCPIEKFETLARREHFEVVDRRFYFINPHYETKFGLHPRRLTPLIGCIPWVRNFFTTSSFYIIRQ
jgi:SAM-dependent methyltransferase